MNRIVTRGAALIAAAAALSVTGCRTAPPPLAPEAAQTSEEFQPFDTPPTLTHYVAPHYPEAARRDGLTGTVMVRVVVGTDGSVAEAGVVRSDDDALSQAALAAARQFRFEPGRLEGKPVRCAVLIPVKFSL